MRERRLLRVNVLQGTGKPVLIRRQNGSISHSTYAASLDSQR